MDNEIRQIERRLMWDSAGNIRHKVLLVVLQPITLWAVTGSKPLNAYYGNAQISGLVAQRKTLPVGTQIALANNTLYLGSQKLLLADPDENGPFDRNIGPGTNFCVAQKIRDGVLDFVDQRSESKVMNSKRLIESLVPSRKRVEV